MSFTTKHPQYMEKISQWQKMQDTYEGEDVVKGRGQTYLPPTPGQLIDGMADGQDGLVNYNGYKLRARFPDYVAQAVEAILGIMHHKPPTISLPKKLEPLLERATIRGESMDLLLRRINEHQLVTGRVGLLADIVSGATVGTLPYIAMYDARTIINWDDGRRESEKLQQLNLVVLDESEWERLRVFEWEKREKFRVLVLGDPVAGDGSSRGVYRMALVRGPDTTKFSEDQLIEPSVAGRTLDEIPFVIINSKDIVPEPDDPPLLGLADLCLAIYRGEADYRQTLFMQGQETLVIIGGTDDDTVRAGAGAKIEVVQGGDAKYIGVSSRGLVEMRKALENDRKEAADAGGKLLDAQSREAESGDALRIRVSARTASLHQIALAGAEGLRAVLRMIATWVGANPDDVEVIPNTDFADDEADGKTLVDFVTARSMGAPLSKRSIHRYMQDRDLTEMTYEEEMAEIEKEAPEPTDEVEVDDDDDDDDDDES